ncbi:Uncharacterized protein PFLU_1077 [Pseudomonas [fluorescens] SBW25]|uniref:Uncharacterized protein n=1 Tax=Pseudomonas fluorescens (strain SBW25) TaxID=216595 RepID=C3K7H3_PSEFS|nr:Uncharacterized protein PFLU_1077 [Pseudomonas fluorescens SBW25]
MVEQYRIERIQRAAEQGLGGLPELIQAMGKCLFTGGAQQQVGRALEVFDLEPEHRQHLVDRRNPAQAFAASGQFVAQGVAPVQVFAEQSAESAHRYTSVMA